uniref:Uncharacterized protein n=1 Tax=Osugoroshi virus TaxID=2202814 RepID=A0A7R7T1S3_9VIRU|nr:hypothetical protein [Osugoroshi virus]
MKPPPFRFKRGLYLLKYLLLILSLFLPCISSECVTTIGCLKDTTLGVSNLVQQNDELLNILSSLHHDLQDQGTASANFSLFTAKPCKFLQLLLCNQPLRLCDFDSSLACTLYAIGDPFLFKQFYDLYYQLLHLVDCGFAKNVSELQQGKSSPCTEQAKFCNFGSGISSALKPCPPISGCYEYGIQPIWSVLRSSTQCGQSVEYAGGEYQCVPSFRIDTMITPVQNGPNCVDYLECDGTYACN